VNARAKGKVKPRVEGKVKPRVEGKVKPRVEGKVKPRAEGKVKPRAESKVKPRAEGMVRPRAECMVKPGAEGMVKPRAEGMVKPRAEGKVKLSAEDKVKPEAELWPPKQPDMSALDIGAMIEPKPIVVTANSQLYKLKECRRVYKSGGSQREFDMMTAAGECSVKAYGRTLVRNPQGEVLMTGFIMDLEMALEPKAVKPGQRRFLIDKMISVVLALHHKGVIHGDIKPANMLLCSDQKLRLCDFAEARRVDEDLNNWDGDTTVNYMSPLRCRNWPDGPDPPPTIEDDLYGLGLSIWELFTGKVPFENDYIDDILNTVKDGQTVDVNEVKEEEMRGMICKYLRYGGAKV
jgi:Protein kinase domain